METAVVRLSMPGGVGGQRREPLPTRLTPGATGGGQGKRIMYPQFALGVINIMPLRG
jgi:hypothetical protein